MWYLSPRETENVCQRDVKDSQLSMVYKHRYCANRGSLKKKKATVEERKSTLFARQRWKYLGTVLKCAQHNHKQEDLRGTFEKRMHPDRQRK